MQIFYSGHKVQLSTDLTAALYSLPNEVISTIPAFHVQFFAARGPDLLANWRPFRLADLHLAA